MKRTLILGDIHFKWNHKRACQQVIQAAKELNPDAVVQVGDEHDFILFTKYARDMDLLTPRQELDDSRECRLKFYAQLRSVLRPSTPVYRMRGNHDDRAMKRIRELAPAYGSIVSNWLEDYTATPGTESIREAEFVLDGVLYEHGYLSALGDHAKRNLNNTVVGHTHTGGLRNFPLVGRRGVWELNVGWLGDRNAPVFNYAPKKLSDNTTLGFGFIDQYGPRFCYL